MVLVVFSLAASLFSANYYTKAIMPRDFSDKHTLLYLRLVLILDFPFLVLPTEEYAVQFDVLTVER